MAQAAAGNRRTVAAVEAGGAGEVRSSTRRTAGVQSVDAEPQAAGGVPGFW